MNQYDIDETILAITVIGIIVIYNKLQKNI